MTCNYQKNKRLRQINKLEMIIARNESYVAYYDMIIREGRATEHTYESRELNIQFLEKMRAELNRLESE